MLQNLTMIPFQEVYSHVLDDVTVSNVTLVGLFGCVFWNAQLHMSEDILEDILTIYEDIIWSRLYM